MMAVKSLVLLLLLSCLWAADAFVSLSQNAAKKCQRHATGETTSIDEDSSSDRHYAEWQASLSSMPSSILSSRRSVVTSSLALLLVVTMPSTANAATLTSTTEDASTSMYAPKFVQEYGDFTQTASGMSYRDVNNAPDSSSSGAQAQVGDRVVYDWSGYTIGYFGRPFQAKGGPQGGAFDKDIDYERTVLGSGRVVGGLEEAFLGMTAGAVRQVIVPFGPLSYPEADDPSHERVGPKPSTFSGQRALNFVLDNPRLDRTLLFNIKVIRIDKPNAQGGFTRG